MLRVLRQIQEVLACQDGSEALVLCSDGGVFYCSPLRGVFEELTDLQVPVGVNATWSLRRVGSQGTLLLVQATKLPSQTSVTVTASPLAGNNTSTNLATIRWTHFAAELVSNSVSLPKSIPGDRWQEMQCFHNPIFTETARAHQTAKPTEGKLKAVKGKPPRPMMPVKPAHSHPKESSGKENRATPLRSNQPPGPSALKSNVQISTPFNLSSVASAQYISPKDPVAAMVPFYASAQKSCAETSPVVTTSDVTTQTKSPLTSTSKPWRVAQLEVREVTLPAVTTAHSDKMISLNRLSDNWVAEALRFVDTLKCVELQRFCDVYVLEASRAVTQLGNDTLRGSRGPSVTDASVALSLRSSLAPMMVRNAATSFVVN